MHSIKGLSLFGLILCPILSWAVWLSLPDVPSPANEDGSAMCYGKHEDIGYVWLLHGRALVPPGHGYFNRYDIGQHQWNSEELAGMPQSPGTTGEGAGIAYVPDSFAQPGQPATGWIFGFKGNHTDEFWVYKPGDNAWVSCPSPQQQYVEAGGALCFGGYHPISGTKTAFVYAFTGTENVWNQGIFLRYRFDAAGPEYGSWENLSPYPDPVDGASAMAWCRPATATEFGNVYAMIDDGGWIMHEYNAGLGIWGLQGGFMPGVPHPGMAMATAPGGTTIWCFRGGGFSDWWSFDANSGAYRYLTQPQDRTWRGQVRGASLCSDGNWVYAELGNTGFPEFKKYAHMEMEEEESDGGQGDAATAADGRLSVSVTPGAGAHTFRLSGALHGRIVLNVSDPLGRTVFAQHVTAATGEAAIVWYHAAAPAGVYFYRVETPDAVAGGKLILTR